MRRLICVVIALGTLLAGLAGCEAPKRLITYPEGTLPVQYEPATTHSTCLVASVAMAANYLVGSRQLTETGIRQAVKAAGKDETSIEDLENRQLYMLTLSGRLNAKPPVDLGYWVRTRGYPVICVLNQNDDDPAFNHAVVVTGIVKASEAQKADTIYYLDPSTPRPMQSLTPEEFDRAWARAGRAMIIVVAPPPESQPAGRR